MTEPETEPDLPVSVQEPLAEAWVDSGLLQGRGTDYSSLGGCAVLAYVLLKEVASTPTIVWPEARLPGGNKAPPVSRNLD